jgi:hypothetical protein
MPLKDEYTLSFDSLSLLKIVHTIIYFSFKFRDGSLAGCLVVRWLGTLPASAKSN